MPSFEQKPQAHIHACSTLQDIIWTHPRSSVPPLLVGRITLQRWQTTFDAIEERYRYVLDSFGKMKPWIFIPCFICCTLRAMATVSSEAHNGWMNLLQSEQQYYSSVGIQVSLAREIYSTGAGSDRNIKNEIVGLKFDICQLLPSQQQAVVASGDGYIENKMAVPIALPVTNPQLISDNDSSSDMIAKLERLDHLYRNGALTHEEYENAKAKVLK